MLVNIGKYIGFCVYRRSYLLWMISRNIILKERGNDESDRSTVVAHSKQWSAAGFLDMHQVSRLYARRLQSN